MLLHVVFVFALPPLLLGVINKVKAFFAGRVGPPLVQPYRDIWKLLHKDSVYSRTTTWVFRAGPVVGVATASLAALLVPLGSEGSLIAFSGDVILLAYLFGLGRFFTVAAALDTGSPFEGMGAAREATFSCLAEPALFFGLLVLARSADTLSVAHMLGPGLAVAWTHQSASLVLVVVSLFIVLLAENSRIPFDDPNTHLELTMVHEVMVLDHGGPGLGLILYGASLKLLVLGAIVVRIALPWTGDPWVGWLVFLGGMGLLAVVIGVVESTMARLRMVHVPSLLVAASLLSAFGLVLGAR